MLHAARCKGGAEKIKKIKFTQKHLQTTGVELFKTNLAQNREKISNFDKKRFLVIWIFFQVQNLPFLSENKQKNDQKKANPIHHGTQTGT